MTYEEQLDLALKDDFIRTGDSVLDTDNMAKLLFLIVHEYERDEMIKVHEYPDNPAIRAKIVDKIEYYTTDGREPSFDLGPNWADCLLCQSIALLRHKQRLWELFTKIQQDRMTLIMEMFAYMWNFGCNDNNNYGTGWGLKGNYGKWRGPNYRLANTSLILYLTSFFDSIENINNLFINLNYDDISQRLLDFGMTRAYATWTTPGARTLIEQGGDARITVEEYGLINNYKRGSGLGVKIPVSFKDNLPFGLIHFLYNNCFSGGKCQSIINDCYIKDNTISPVEGQDGMMLEFNMENDGLGFRSSLLHCLTDFYLIMGMAMTLWHLRISKLQVYKNYHKVQVGLTDFIYKFEHGYYGKCLGQDELISNSAFDGARLFINYFNDHYAIEGM